MVRRTIADFTISIFVLLLVTTMVGTAGAQGTAGAGRSTGAMKSLHIPLPPPPPEPPGVKALTVARQQLGKPYGWGTTGPGSFDCSGLTEYCFANGAGVSLPRTSWQQASCGSPVAAADLRPGDIVGFRGWEHVGIYAGADQYIHAPHTGDVVKVSSVSQRGDLCGARRI